MRIAASCFLLAGAGLGVVHHFGSPPAQHGWEGPFATGAYGLAVASPGLVTLAARQPLVTLAAGFGGVMVALFASFGITLPLVIPAVALVVHAANDGPVRVARADAARALLVALAIPASIAVLFFVHEDPVRWSTSTSSGGSSDMTVWWESLASVVLVVAAVVFAAAGREGSLSRGLH